MWNKLVLASALLAGLVAFGPLAGTASAQPPKKATQIYVSPPIYPGYNPASVTPFATSFGGGPLNPLVFEPPVIATIPLNNQDMNIYSGSFGNFGWPNGLSLSYNAYAPAYGMPYYAPFVSPGLAFSPTYVPPAFYYGGYNPASVTPFK